jgi:hypothetical protein
MYKIQPYIYFSLLCFILIGCGGQQTGDQGPSLTYSAFMQKIQQKGISTTITKAFNADLFSGTAHGLMIQNEQISVFEYETNDAMQAEASNISSDGSTIHNQNGGATAVDWIAPPHFYKAGHILVLYVGKNQYITSLLQSILGPQFAGG